MAHHWLVNMPVDPIFIVVSGPFSTIRFTTKCLSDFRRVFAVTARYSIRKNALCGSCVTHCGQISSTCRDGKPY